MEFSAGKGGAGSLAALLNDEPVRQVFSLYADKCLEYYGIDVREHKSLFNTAVLKQVRAFVQNYGVDDSKRIIYRMFSPLYGGCYKGKTIGASIFSSRYRWLADMFLIEQLRNENE